MRDRRRSGDEQDVRRTTQQPRLRYGHRSFVEAGRDFVQRVGLQRREASEREERHVRHAFRRELVDEGVVFAVGDV